MTNISTYPSAIYFRKDSLWLTGDSNGFEGWILQSWTTTTTPAWLVGHLVSSFGGGVGLFITKLSSTLNVHPACQQQLSSLKHAFTCHGNTIAFSDIGTIFGRSLVWWIQLSHLTAYSLMLFLPGSRFRLIRTPVSHEPLQIPIKHINESWICSNTN